MKSKEVYQADAQPIQTSFRLDDQTHLHVVQIMEKIKEKPVPDGWVLPSVAVVFGFLVHKAIEWVQENKIDIARLDVEPSKNLTIQIQKSDNDWLAEFDVTPGEQLIKLAEEIAAREAITLPPECKTKARTCFEFVQAHSPNAPKNPKYKPPNIHKYALVVACINLAYDMLSLKDIHEGIYQWSVYRQLYADSGKR